MKIIDKTKLINMIQNLRREMQQIAKEKGIHSKDVLKLSNELDILLNKYEKLISKE